MMDVHMQEPELNRQNGVGHGDECEQRPDQSTQRKHVLKPETGQ
jgi:hypothetical protein